LTNIINRTIGISSVVLIAAIHATSRNNDYVETTIAGLQAYAPAE
jgi:hypothetical protein